MDNKFYKDQLISMAERLIDLADKIGDGSTPLNTEERKLFRVGMSNHVQGLLQEAHHFYLVGSDRDIEGSFCRIRELSEAINL